MSLLSQFSFKGRQEQAATDPNAAILVTAGAGSGKTLSLVGRYLYLLERGYPLRSILAITFTEKAAREMRSRIREALSRASIDSIQINLSKLDSAHIGTIHSLCAEILRAHPAEAGLDPAFVVLEEGLAAALQAKAIDAALDWAANDAQSAVLFSDFKENELRQMLKTLMGKRLDLVNLCKDDTEETDLHEKEPDPTHENSQNQRDPRLRIFESTLQDYLQKYLDFPVWHDSLSDLTTHWAVFPDDKLELARKSVLAYWTEIQSARASQNWDVVLSSLAALRKSIDTRGGKKGAWEESDLAAVRDDMTALKDIYEEYLKFLAEKSRFALDKQVAAHLPAMCRLIDRTLYEYQRRKDELQALDFDDLEGLTAQLLGGHPIVRTELQAEFHAVLVDEFQDTNERQRQIIYALTGFSPSSRGDFPIKEGRRGAQDALAQGAMTQRALTQGALAQSAMTQKALTQGALAQGDLFIVGDPKQSIYKFRGADVSVFRQVQADIESAGGLCINLDLTFRAHKSLLETLNNLLAPILGEKDDPTRPYYVPFAPLRPYRQKPAHEIIQPPFVEFHLGLGENAEQARLSAAAALAHRLRQLHELEGFAWGEMALLFRTSNTFAIYENALESENIPFITVAGRGFYDRPEIRDLLNALAAISDPTDDLALVGLLRSPAFAISDGEIYQLRFDPNRQGHEENPKKFGLLSGLCHSINSSHQRAYDILTELQSFAGRAPVAAVLKRFLDLTGYRAILGSVPRGERMIRNVEKLLADAHRSRMVGLPGFLAYVRTLRDVGLREGEAPVDATSSGAVQLMTVHKAKGLEFPFVVLADAAYESHGRIANVQLTPRNILLDLRDGDFHPTAWQFASRLEDDREDAENRRLLYVAATRAKEKLLISAHVKLKRDGSLSLAGWLNHFGLDHVRISREMSQPEEFSLTVAGTSLRLYPVSPVDVGFPLPVGDPSTRTGESGMRADLLEPLTLTSPGIDEKTRARESDPPQRVWRIVSTTKRPTAPAWVVGKLVHEALRRWRFPDPDFENFMRPFALESGFTDPQEIRTAILESRRLLEQLRAHPIFNEIDSAERHHEIPYFLPEERGVIDLLYRTKAGWFIVDFKTDQLQFEEQALAASRDKGYDQQLARYVRAVANQLNIQARARLIFLNVSNRVAVFDL